jgi:hypothetical protein
LSIAVPSAIPIAMPAAMPAPLPVQYRRIFLFIADRFGSVPGAWSRG